jgi:hypothetical protein
MTTFDQVLHYVQVVDRVLDIVKIDIEYGEFDIIRELDIDYWCKYVKQFLVETHLHQERRGASAKWLAVLRRLETCFSLFRRDTRFFSSYLAEFQEPRTYKIDVNLFDDEIDLTNYMTTFGELYFVNRNFVRVA